MAVAPTLSRLRLIKTVLSGFSDRADLALEAATTLGGVVRLPVPGRDVFLVSAPEAVHRVMIQNHANYTKSPDYKVLANFLGEGLLTSDDATWEVDRKRVQPLFANRLL